MPTLVAFVIDTPRCAAPQTFMTNMLQVGCPFASVACHWHAMLRCAVPHTFRTNMTQVAGCLSSVPGTRGAAPCLQQS